MRVQFHNHACFSIEDGDHYLLFDPWLDGRVFNESWSLMRPTNLDEIKFDKLTHILYSHEHPDHLHFPTLKLIRERCSQDVTVCFPYRKKDNVKPVIEKYPFEYQSIQLNDEEVKIGDRISFAYFANKTGGDHTIMFNLDGKILANQNDHYTPQESMDLIHARYPRVDLLMTQFSLAGYYGNDDDPEGLKKNGHDWHLERVGEFTRAFEPAGVIPFASYVYFCKKYNSYLNDYVVAPREVYDLLGPEKAQMVTYDDEILWEPEAWKARNPGNLKKLEALFAEEKAILPHEKVEIDALVSVMKKKIGEIPLARKFSSKFLPRKALLSTYVLKLKDYENQYLRFNLRSGGSVEVLEDVAVEDVTLEIPSDDCDFMFKFPWGADTANITGTYSRRDEAKCSELLAFMNDLYVK